MILGCCVPCELGAGPNAVIEDLASVNSAFMVL